MTLEPKERENGELWFDVVLPATIVRGRVVDETRNPVRHAIVTLSAGENEDDYVFEQTTTEDDGTFEIFGFAPGMYQIQAEGERASSEIATIEASDTEPLEVELVVREIVIVKGRLRSRNATPVEAQLFAWPRDVRTTLVPLARTDGNGQFELRLPPRTRVFDLVVHAPGFALALGRVTVQSEKLLTLTLTLEQIGGELALEVPRGSNALLRHGGSEYSPA